MQTAYLAEQARQRLPGAQPEAGHYTTLKNMKGWYEIDQAYLECSLLCFILDFLFVGLFGCLFFFFYHLCNIIYLVVTYINT